jgi:hypothetical protein
MKGCISGNTRIAGLALILALVFLCQAAMAQVTTARLEGVIKDQTEAVVPGVTVVATQTGTNLTFEAVSNEIGFYLFPRLPPGNYAVTAELTGFKKSINQGIHLEIGDTATLNIGLQAGGTNETVTVTAQVAVIDTVSTSVSKVVSTMQIEALPLVARDPMQLFYLQPGTNRFTGGGRVDGTRNTAANVTVEGIGATEPILGGGATSTTAAVPIEAVGEYRVVTSSASAEYGRGGGAQIQLVYRSGTNEFHGSAFDFHRNKALNANSFANNKQGLPRPTYIRNQFGGSIGGPVIKDRAFFHFTYEGIRQKTESTPNFLVYTPTLKNSGIFRYYTKGANSTTLVDSLTGVPKVPDTDIATINLLTVDSSRLGKDPSGLFDKLVGSFPNPNNYDTGDGFNTAGYRMLSTNPYTQNQIVFKGDYTLTAGQRVSATYTYRKYKDVGAIVALTGSREPNEEPYPTGILAWDSTLTPRWLNEFRVGATKRGSFFLNTDPDRFKPEGIVIFAGLGGPGRGHPKDIFLPQVFPSPVITITDNTTWVKSVHSLKGGVDVRINRSNVKYGDDYYFPVATTTNANNPANVPSLPGLASADRSRAQQLTNDLTGTLGFIQQSYHSNVTDAYTPFETKYRRWRSREYSFFFQDTWKARPNLTLNLGLRYEIMPPHFEAAGVYSYPLNPATANWGISGPSGETKLGIAADGGKSITTTDWNNFAPNVGFNWDPFSTGKWSISGNFRMSYDRTWLATTLFVDFDQEGMSTARTLNAQSGTRLSALPNLFNSRTGYFDPGVPFGPKAFDRNGNINIYDPGLYTPYMTSWSMRMQREIFRGTALAVSYVGNKASGMPRAIDVNQLQLRKNGFLDGFLAAQRNLLANNNPMTGEATGVFGQIYNIMATADKNSISSDLRNGSVATVANFIDRSRASSKYLENAGLPLSFFRANPQFNTSYLIGNNSYSTYHGLKVEVTRRFQSGLQFDFNYTFSKCLTDYEGGQSQRDAYRDLENRRLDKRLAGIDATHVINANFIWHLPVGNGRHWLKTLNPILEGILGGWQTNGIFALATGSPFTISSGRNKLTLLDASTANCLECDPSMTAKVVRDGGNLRALTAEEIKLFTDPVAGSAGYLAQNFFRGSRTWVLDGSIFKSFRLHRLLGEQGELQTRFEFFNAFNHTRFGNPTSNLTDGNFGIISPPTGNARIIQGALKILF